MSDGDDEYKIGYGRPPKHTRFRKGQSGNRKGRPKGARNFKTELREALTEKTTVTQGARPRKVTARMAALLRLREKALEGDPRAIDRFLQFAHQLDDEDLVTEARSLTSTDHEILERFRQRQGCGQTEAGGPADDGGGHDAG
ncbi:DUF5681 domain-containing protein [Rhodovulum sp. YNF3179]|uniref:DUF5681 domain-containing protein n=1 Tax=Rhodovulum sp. YNF3179 TaxID=3425127 RepID=UPI003D33E879